MKTKASVKIMRSYDYNHFEVSLSTDELIDEKEVNSLRVRAAKLVDHSIDDYKKKKNHESWSINNSYERKDLEQKVKAIEENFPKSQWTSEQKAQVKKLEDMRFQDRFEYDDQYEY